VQEEIFARSFAGTDHWLFLIGYPKQAICYGFPGSRCFHPPISAPRGSLPSLSCRHDFRSIQPLVKP